MLLVRRSNRALTYQLLSGSSKLVAEQETLCPLVQQSCRISEYRDGRHSIVQYHSSSSRSTGETRNKQHCQSSTKNKVGDLSTRLFSQAGSISSNARDNRVDETVNAIPTKSVDEGGRDWDTMKEMFRYIKPQGDFHVKARIGAALGLLLGSKALNVQVPFMFKYAGASYMLLWEFVIEVSCHA